MKYNSNKHYRANKPLYKLIIGICIILLLAYLALYNTIYTNTNADTNAYNMANGASLLRNPLDIFTGTAEKVLQPIYIQSNSWRLLNRHVYILDGNNRRMFSNHIKIELGLAGPRTVSLYFPTTNKYLCHNNLDVNQCSVNHLANHKLLLGASWVPFVSINTNGTRCYSFAIALDYKGKYSSNEASSYNGSIWLDSNAKLTTNVDKRGRFYLRDMNTDKNIPATIASINETKYTAIVNDNSTGICDPKCRSQLDLDKYHKSQEKYMNDYFSYYDKSHTIDNFKNTQSPASNANTNIDSMGILETIDSMGILDSMDNIASYNNSKEGFRGKNIRRMKRDMKALKEQGMLDDLIVKDMEMFEDMDSDAMDIDGNFNAGKADVFKPHRGVHFNDILNHHFATVSHDDAEDQLFNKLEKAKMDPSVQNLLDYNEERYKIYESENNAFEKRLDNRVRQNTNESHELTRRMDQYRIRNMARRLFFLQNNMA